MKTGLALSGPTPVTMSVMAPLVKEPVMFVTRSPPGPVVAVSVPLPVKGKPPREGNEAVADQFKVMVSASAGSIGVVSKRANPVQTTKARPIFMISSYVRSFPVHRIEKGRRNKGMTKSLQKKFGVCAYNAPECSIMIARSRSVTAKYARNPLRSAR
jgi:hypothetical protein